MKRILILVILSIMFCAGSALANEQTHRQAVEELLTVSRVDQMFAPMIDKVMAMMDQQMAQVRANIPEEKQPIIQKYNQKIVDTLRADMGWAQMKEPFVDIYLSVYNEEEIRELTGFYRSPLGQKMLDKMPILMEKSMEISQQLMMKTMPKIQKLTEEMLKELQPPETGKQN